MRKATLIILAAIIILISIYGYYGLIRQNGGLTGLSISEKKVVYEENKEPEVYFTHQNITPLLLGLFEDSEDIRCALYDATEQDIVFALKRKNAKVAVEDENYENEFQTSPSSGSMHNKFCVLDNKTVITGSTNLNDEGVYKNDNNILIIYSAFIAKNYLEEFEEIYSSRFGQGEKVRYPSVIINNKTMIQNYFCPEDECQKHVLEELDNAKTTIYFMTFSFTDKAIADKLIQKKSEGVKVEGVFEKQRYNNQYEIYKYLNESNITVIPDKNKYIMHHKVFIIDNETVITGSYNPTASGNKYNDENIIIINDKEIAEKYLEEFERLKI